MKKFSLLSVFFLSALVGFAQTTPVSADLGFSDAHFENLSGIPIDANKISYLQVVRIKVRVHNFSETETAPAGHFRIKIGLGAGMEKNPTFNLSTAPLSNYFTWTYDITQAQPQIIGTSIQALPPDFLDVAVFELKAMIPEASTVSYNLLIANPPNTTTPLSVPDGSNNVAANQYTIAEQLTFTQTTQNVSCFGAANGSIAVTPDGGIPDPNYSITILNTTTSFTSTLSSPTTVTFTNLAQGNYNITVTDPHGNTATGTTTISQPTAPLSASASAPPIACNGGTTTLSVSAAGGTPAYTYSLNGGTPQSSNDFTVPAGTYTVTVKDNNNCTVQTAPVTIANPAVVPPPTGSASQSFCNVATVADLTATGQNIQWYASNSGTTPLPASTPLVNGNHYYATQTVGGCESPSRLDVTVVINTMPVFTTCPSNVSVNTDNNLCTALVNYTATASGSPAPAYSYTFSGATTASGSGTGSGSAFSKGITTVVITAANTCGSPTCTFTVTVTDVQPPTITAPGALSVFADAGQCNATNVNLGTPVVGDNCGTPSVSNNAPSFLPVGSTTVTWTVTDASGNTATATQIVTVADNQPPTITAPGAVSVSAGAGQCSASNVSLGTPVTSDNCGVATVTNNAPSAFPVGSTTVTWTVTDIHNNTNTATQVVTVTDNQNPTISAPPPVTVNANPGLCSASGVILGTPAAADNCGMPSVSNDAPSSFPVGVTTVTWTATDASSNTATATQTVTVIDNQNPTITAPANITVNASNGFCYATGIVLGTPVTADNCGVQSVTNSALSQTQFSVGVTTVTWTVTDVNNNMTTATQTVTVIDNQPPTITAPTAINANANAGQCYATGITLGTPSTGDNCGVASVVNDAPAQFPVGQTTVTWTVTDVNGNTAMATQTVTVADNQAPMITAPANINTSPNNVGCSAIVSLGTPTTADNCGVQSVSKNAPSSFPLGTTTVTWTVTDIHGLTATATQTVTVTSTLSATAAAVNNVPCHGGTTTLTVNTTGGTAPYAYSLNGGTPQNGNTFTVGAGTHSVTITDANGCTTTATKTITQPPGTKPDITVSVADYSDNFFPAPTTANPNPAVTLIYQFVEVGGNPALKDTLSITKQSGYTYTFLSGTTTTVSGSNYTIDNNRWTVDNSHPGIYRIVINDGEQIGCGQSVYLAVKVTRTTPSKSTFPLSSFGRLRWVGQAPEETNLTNNATTIVLVGQ